MSANSVFANLEEFFENNPYKTWKEFSPQEFNHLKYGYYPPSDTHLNITTLTLTRNTKTSDILYFLAEKYRLTEKGFQTMYVDTYPLDEHIDNYFVTCKGIKQKLKGKHYPKSIVFKTSKNTQTAVLHLYWENYSSTGLRNKYLELPSEKEIQTLLPLLLLPPQNTVMLDQNLECLYSILSAATSQNNIPKTPKFKSLNKAIETVGYKDDYDFHKLTNYFLKDLETKACKDIHNEWDQLSYLFSRIYIIEKIWLISVCYIAHKICPIPCALSFCTRQKPEDLYIQLFKFVENILLERQLPILNATNSIPPDSIINTPWKHIDRKFSATYLQLYIQTLKVKNEVFEHDMENYQITKERCALLNLYMELQNKMGNSKSNLFSKHLLKHDKKQFLNAEYFWAYFQTKCKSISGPGGPELVLLSLAFTEPKLVHKKLKTKPEFFACLEKQKLIHFFHSSKRDLLKEHLVASTYPNTALEIDFKPIIKFDKD